MESGDPASLERRKKKFLKRVIHTAQSGGSSPPREESPTPQDDHWSSRHGRPSGAVDGITYQRQMQLLEAEKAQVASMGGSMVTPENRSAIRQLIDAISSERIPPSPNSAAARAAAQQENPARLVENSNSLSRGAHVHQGNIPALSQGMSLPPQPQITHTASVSGGWGYPGTSLPGPHPPGGYGLQGANQWGAGTGYHGYEPRYAGMGMGGIYGGPIPAYPVHYPVHGHGQYFDPRGYAYVPQQQQQHTGQAESFFYGDAGGYAVYQGGVYGENLPPAQSISTHYPRAAAWETAPAAPPPLSHPSSHASLVAVDSYTNQIAPSEEGKTSEPANDAVEELGPKNTGNAKLENTVSAPELPREGLSEKRKSPTDAENLTENEHGEYPASASVENTHGETGPGCEGEHIPMDKMDKNIEPVTHVPDDSRQGGAAAGEGKQETRREETGGVGTNDEHERVVVESVGRDGGETEGAMGCGVDGNVGVLGRTDGEVGGGEEEGGKETVHMVTNESEFKESGGNDDVSVKAGGERESRSLNLSSRDQDEGKAVAEPQPSPAVAESQSTTPLPEQKEPPRTLGTEPEPAPLAPSPKLSELRPSNETPSSPVIMTTSSRQPMAGGRETVDSQLNSSNLETHSRNLPPASPQQKPKEPSAPPPPPERTPLSLHDSPVKSNPKPPISGGGTTDSIGRRSPPPWVRSQPLIGFTGLTTVATVQPANRHSIPRLGPSQSQPVLPSADRERSNSGHSIHPHPVRNPHSHRSNDYDTNEIHNTHTISSARNLFPNTPTSPSHRSHHTPPSTEKPHDARKSLATVTKSPSAPVPPNTQTQPTGGVFLTNGQRENFTSPRIGGMGSAGREVPVSVERGSAVETPVHTPVPSDTQPHLLPQRIQSLPVDMWRGAQVFHRMGPPLMIPPTSPRMQNLQNPPSGGSLGGRLPSNPNLVTNEEVGRLMAEIAGLRGTVHALQVENAQLSGKSEKLAEINRELKRLMVASLGDDLARDIADLTQAKVELSREVADMKMEMDDMNEMMSQGQIDADVWRTKYHAAEVMVRELSARATQATERVQALEAERARASAAVTECHGLLHAVVKHMRKRDGRTSIWDDEEYESAIQQVPPIPKGPPNAPPPPDHHAQISESAARLASLVASALVMSMASLSLGVLSRSNTQPVQQQSPGTSRTETTPQPSLTPPQNRPSSVVGATSTPPPAVTQIPSTSSRNNDGGNKKQNENVEILMKMMTPQAQPPPRAEISDPKAHISAPSEREISFSSDLYPPGPVSRSEPLQVQTSRALAAAPPPENSNSSNRIDPRSTGANHTFASTGANENILPLKQPPISGVAIANPSTPVDDIETNSTNKMAPLVTAANGITAPPPQMHSSVDPARSADGGDAPKSKSAGVEGANSKFGTSGARVQENFGRGGGSVERGESPGLGTTGKVEGKKDGEGVVNVGEQEKRGVKLKTQKRTLDVSDGCSKCKGKILQV